MMIDKLSKEEQAIDFLRRKISKDPYSAEEYRTAIEALERQIKEKNIRYTPEYFCHSCEKEITWVEGLIYCYRCGTKIRLEESE